ncbi:amino acid adenylation domain-containing protein [Actinokineospora terrae]|uniref:Amino acid adenylation domain-containing protein n=1 Tax=Actinokineospora terrae TaxID=155974 RepID=A0A1H9MFQ1_9PSEU|nr:amino acid adenylation domain-containing protein [Actinokineospora terrae]SER22275.1 amino acid adenylation domain-containing protein [Actinokineospora terrae]
MLGGINPAAPQRRGEADLYALIEQNLLSHNDRVAVSDDRGDHDYAWLGRRVDEIAGALHGRGCRPGSRVCLAVRHGVDLVASVLAVLKLGATYIPVDTRNPVDRVGHIVADSGATAIVHSGEHTELADRFGLVDVVLRGLGRPAHPIPTAVVQPSDLAYILYTSGSTGNPKGVGITHANLASYVRWAAQRYIDSPDDRVALYTTLAFDFTVTCLFPPLLAGASIAVYDGVRDPMVIQRILADRAVTVIKITPSYLHLVSQLHSGSTHLRRLVVGGEDLPAELAARVHRLLGPVEIINEYGPTEATVGCVVHTFDPETDRDGSVPIGAPIPGTRVYLVDEDDSPALEQGELCLAGAGVAPGYLNRESTAFTDNPFEPGTTLYRTGDIVRRDPRGDLVFVGRKDDQVKIRGNRVELAEVSAAILNHPMVAAAYVTTVREHGTRTLVAVATSTEGLTESLLRKHLEQQLPGYAVPSSLGVVDDLPLTLNQKVDRAAVLTVLGKLGG